MASMIISVLFCMFPSRFSLGENSAPVWSKEVFIGIRFMYSHYNSMPDAEMLAGCMDLGEYVFFLWKILDSTHHTGTAFPGTGNLF